MIGNRIDGVLDDARRITQVLQMIELHLRQRQRLLIKRANGQWFRLMLRWSLGPIERVKVELRNMIPSHAAPKLMGSCSHRQTSVVIAEQPDDFASDRRRIGKGNEHAATVGQQFFGVPIRCRDHGLATTERVGQRARDRLLHIQIGRDVQIGGSDELGQFFQFNETVVEADMLGDAEFFRHAFQADSIAFALLTNQTRMRRTEDE